MLLAPSVANGANLFVHLIAPHDAHAPNSVNIKLKPAIPPFKMEVIVKIVTVFCVNFSAECTLKIISRNRILTKTAGCGAL